MAGGGSGSITGGSDLAITAAEDLHHRTRQGAELVDGRRSMERALDHRSRPRSCSHRQHGGHRGTSELPRRVHVGNGEDRHQGVLDGVLGDEGKCQLGGRPGASVDLPLAGGPNTTTETAVGPTTDDIPSSASIDDRPCRQPALLLDGGDEPGQSGGAHQDPPPPPPAPLPTLPPPPPLELDEGVVLLADVADDNEGASVAKRTASGSEAAAAEVDKARDQRSISPKATAQAVYSRSTPRSAASSAWCASDSARNLRNDSRRSHRPEPGGVRSAIFGLSALWLLHSSPVDEPSAESWVDAC